jgi:hypothetical protein
MVKGSSSCEDSTHQIIRRKAMSTSPTASSARNEVRQVAPRLIELGVTSEETAEPITHVAFYAGWPSAMSAAKVATPGLDRRTA